MKIVSRPGGSGGRGGRDGSRSEPNSGREAQSGGRREPHSGRDAAGGGGGRRLQTGRGGGGDGGGGGSTPAAAPTLSRKAVERKVKGELLGEFLTNQDLSEAKACVKEMNKSRGEEEHVGITLVGTLMDRALNGKTAERDALLFGLESARGCA